MKYCVYYNNKDMNIIEITPTSISPADRSRIEKIWNQGIARDILIEVSREEEITATVIKDKIGHSSSTLHENLSKLEQSGLISTEMVYKGNKQKIIRSNIIAVSKNPEHKRRFNKYFQGIWINSEKSRKIVGFLKKNNKKFFTTEEIASQTDTPIDDVEIILNNWDSYTTRALSDFLKKKPFEKKVLYKGNE